LLLNKDLLLWKKKLSLFNLNPFKFLNN
jgi:hypothetical protein